MNPEKMPNIELVASSKAPVSPQVRTRIEVGHTVQFYENEQFLTAAVSDFLADGLASGQKVLIVATQEHRAAFDKRLSAKGFDVTRARRLGDLIMLDARETLRLFMVGSMPDRKRFIDSLSAVIDSTKRSDQLAGLRIYGEMVDVLWRDGNTEGALRLEDLWNELSTLYAFNLLCAYSMGNFYKAADAETFREVCRKHSQVVPTERYTMADEDARALEVSELQQRARALETEILHREEIEARLRDALLAARRAEDALLERERDLADFFENSAVPMHWVGPDGTILRANGAELDLLGYAREEYVGHHITEFHVEPAAAEDLLARLGRGETLSSQQARLRCKEGSIKDVLIDANVYWGPDGDFVHTRCITRDITDRRTADEARARLAAIVASSDDAIVGKTLDGIITTWNPGAERIFGYTAAEAVGQHISLIIPAELRWQEDDVLARLRRGERVDHFETVRMTKEGRRADISLTVSPIRNSEGQIIGASKVARDVTERRRTEALAECQRRALQLLAEDAPLDEVLGLLIEMVERHSGKALASIVPLNEAGTHFQRGIGSSLPAAFNDAVDGVAVSSFNGICSYAVSERRRVIAPDFTADPKWAHFAAFVAPFGLRAGWSTPILGSHGTVLATFATYYREACDPTPPDLQLVDMVARTAAIAIERKRSDIALQRERMAAESARRAAEEARAAAESANRAKAEFLAAMSHELRTPLNAIGGYAQLLKMGVHGPVTEAQREALNRIEKSEQYLLSLINDVLNFAKLEAGKVNYDIEDVLLSDVVAQTALIMEPQLAAKELRFERVVDAGILVRADQERLVQILLNLLSNAVKFTPAGGRIAVRARADTRDKCVVVAVSDSGPGIPPNRREAVFDPFVQLHEGTTKGSQGTGLGLAISRDLARGMNGDLSVDETHAPGAAFLLMLPTPD